MNRLSEMSKFLSFRYYRYYSFMLTVKINDLYRVACIYRVWICFTETVQVCEKNALPYSDSLNSSFIAEEAMFVHTSGAIIVSVIVNNQRVAGTGGVFSRDRSGYSVFQVEVRVATSLSPVKACHSYKPFIVFQIIGIHLAHVVQAIGQDFLYTPPSSPHQAETVRCLTRESLFPLQKAPWRWLIVLSDLKQDIGIGRTTMRLFSVRVPLTFSSGSVQLADNNIR